MIITVTRHALRRFIERVDGFEFNGSDDDAVETYLELTGLREGQIVERMLKEVDGRVPPRSLVTGSRRVVRGETARFIVVGGAIVTVYTEQEHIPRKDVPRPRKRRY